MKKGVITIILAAKEEDLGKKLIVPQNEKPGF